MHILKLTTQKVLFLEWGFQKVHKLELSQIKNARLPNFSIALLANPVRGKWETAVALELDGSRTLHEVPQFVRLDT